MNFLIKTIMGMIIGIAAMTAGAGTFAILFGIYDKCMEIIARPFKDFKNNLIYVTPIVLGILISVLFFGNLIVYFLNNYNSYVKFIFLGIIIGGIPALIKRANEKGFEKKYFIPLAAAFIITLFVTYISNKMVDNTVESKLEVIHLVLYGLIYGFGAIAPGMTTIHLLMFWGVLSPIMEGIFSLNFGVIFPFGIGYLVVVILFANLITFLFKKFYGYTYYAVIGFSITSLTMLIPKLSTTSEFILCPILSIITAIIIYSITKLDSKILNQKTINN